MLACFGAACSYAAKIEEHERTLGEHSQRLSSAVAVENYMLERLDYLLCPNPQVQEFVRACSKRENECSKEAAEEMLTQMPKYRHVLLRYKIGAKVDEIPPVRERQLADIARAHPIGPLTRLLVVALPFGRKSASVPKLEHLHEADELGLAVHNYFLDKIFARERHGVRLQPLLPKTVGCVKRREILASYQTVADDRLVEPEPKEGTPQTMVFVFLVDC